MWGLNRWPELVTLYEVIRRLKNFGARLAMRCAGSGADVLRYAAKLRRVFAAREAKRQRMGPVSRPHATGTAASSYQSGNRNPSPPEPLAFWRRYSA
jgi:hypothetical protein